MIPAGLTDMNIEFFAKDGDLFSIQDGKTYRYPEMPHAHTQFLIDRLVEDPSGQKTMIGIPVDQKLKIYGVCRFGACNHIPDSSENGECQDHQEYYDCGIRKRCPFEGKRCKEILTENGILTSHQVQIMILVAKGLLNKEIADVMEISESTVANHIASISVKINGRNRVDIAMYVKERGIV